MHTVMPWVISFYFVHLASTYCSFESWGPSPTSSLGPAIQPETPTALPPKLTSDLLLDTVSTNWKISSLEDTQDSELPCSGGGVRCVFSRGIGLGDDVNRWDASSKRDFFQPYLLSPEPTGWDIVDETGLNKFGWQPINATSKPLILEFRNVTQQVKSVTLFTIKSYGPNWDNSSADVVVESSSGQEDAWGTISDTTLLGYHNRTTSEEYVEALPLAKAIENGMTVRIRVRLASGNIFKIVGITVCK